MFVVLCVAMMPERKGAALIPYQIRESDIFVFLQKRDRFAPTNPDAFGIFGGSLEGTETPEVGMLREVKEELDWQPDEYTYFADCVEPHIVASVFYTKVSDDFENHIRILEGEYGEFMNIKKIRSHNLIPPYFKEMLDNLIQTLKNKHKLG